MRGFLRPNRAESLTRGLVHTLVGQFRARTLLAHDKRMTKCFALLTFCSLAACGKFEAGERSSPLPTPATAVARVATAQGTEPIDVTVDDTQVPHVARLRILNFHTGADQTLYARIEWRARGAGTLQIAGPEGTLIATGVVLPNGTTWFRDVRDEKPISQLYARGVAFGESDPVTLKEHTLHWLNEVVAPVLDRRLVTPAPLP